MSHFIVTVIKNIRRQAPQICDISNAHSDSIIKDALAKFRASFCRFQIEFYKAGIH